jgi:hypothetical protein
MKGFRTVVGRWTGFRLTGNIFPGGAGGPAGSVVSAQEPPLFLGSRPPRLDLWGEEASRNVAAHAFSRQVSTRGTPNRLVNRMPLTARIEPEE